MRNRACIALLAAVACTGFAFADFSPLYFEVEPNGTIAEAIANNFIGSAAPGGSATAIEGYLDSGDVDWYAFEVEDEAYIGAAAFDPAGVGADGQFQLIDEFGTIIAWDDNSGVGLMPSFEANLPAGTYLLGVSAYADTTFSTGLTELFDGVDSFTGEATEADFTYKVSIVANVIPEPASVVLLSLGLFLFRRR